MRLILLLTVLVAVTARALPPEPVIRLDFDMATMDPADDGWKLPANLGAVNVDLVDGYLGQAMRWRDDDSRLLIPEGPETAFSRQFTVMFWIRPGQVEGHRIASYVMGDGGYERGWRLLQLHGPFGSPYFMFQIGGETKGPYARTDLTAGARARNNDWLHVALSFDAAQPDHNLLVYFNGTCWYKVGSGAEARKVFWSADRSRNVVPTATPGRIVIGGAVDKAPGFVGDLDLLRIYDVALKPQEVRAAWSRQRAQHRRSPVKPTPPPGDIAIDGDLNDWFGKPQIAVDFPADDFRNGPRRTDLLAKAHVHATAETVYLGVQVADEMLTDADLLDIRLGVGAEAMRLLATPPATGDFDGRGAWQCKRVDGGYGCEARFPRAAFPAERPLDLRIAVVDMDDPAEPPGELRWQGRLELPQ